MQQKQTQLREIKAAPESFCAQDITLCGWVRTIRDSRKIAFLELHDGSCFSTLQIVLEAEKLPNFAQIIKCGVGTALRIRGRLLITPQANQPFELHAAEIQIEGASAAEYPLQKKRHSLEFLRGIAHLRPRTNTFIAAFRVRSAAAFAIHRFFMQRGFTYVHTPILSCSDAEGAGEMFRVTTLDAENPPRNPHGAVDFAEDFFGKQAFLTVSGQLQGEALALALGKIYTFGPTFRAEKSYTPRHAAEFWMIEPEIAFANLADDRELAQSMLQFVIREVLEQCPEELVFCNQFFDKGLLTRLEQVASAEFAHIRYDEAIVLLEPHNAEFQYPAHWGSDLQTEHERYLTEQVFHRPVFVTDYPKEIKAFYMRLNDDGKTVAAMDLLVPGVGELIGGSQREERLDVLEERIRACGMQPGDYHWYLDLRRYGGCKHCGFGLGFERLVMYLTGIANIRDVLPFPRTTGSAEF